jgi:hypothetical protein
MADFKNVTLQFLRDLARKHLPKAQAQLKAKQELLSALKKAAPQVMKSLAAKAPVKAVAQKAAALRSGKAKKPAKAAAPAKVAKAKPLKVAAKEPKAAPKKAKPATVVRFAPRKVVRGTPIPTMSMGSAPVSEPLVEGFFVARIAGEVEARRHRLTEELAHPAVETRSSPTFHESLGDLPATYADDELVLLARDPRTAFAFWDFSHDTRAVAMEGLKDPKAVLRVFEADALVRELDVALESHSFYIHDLPPGRRYRVEAYFVGQGGAAKRIGRSSNSVLLPAFGASTDTSVRLVRIPWELSLKRFRELLKTGEVAAEERPGQHRYMTWRRITLPNSAEAQAYEAWSVPEHSEDVRTGWVPPRSGRPY